jgi:prepilin-type N-terminal cleavage/methylation domain-containing protein
MLAAQRRPGFTMLEILIALAIGLLLLAALYFAVTVQMRSAQIGRQMMQENTLARSLFRRIDNDLNATLNLTDPARWRNQAISSSMSNTNNTSNGIFQTSTIVIPPPTAGGYYPSGFGPSDNQHLNVFFTRFPRDAYQPSPDDTNPADSQITNQASVSDLRRISYYYVQGKGLAREEIGQATSDDSLNPAYPDDDSHILAPEVTNVTFTYFDGFDWQQSWDPTVLGADGITPIGSPRAIKILLEIQLPRDEFAEAREQQQKTRQYAHVILVNSANGLTPRNTANTTFPAGGGINQP